MRKARWAHLLEEDEDFRRWYDNLSRGSEYTAKERARILYRFLQKHDMTPSSLVELARKDRRRVEDILSDFISKLHNQGYSPGYMANYLKAVRSWLQYNEVELVRKIKIGNRSRTPTLEEERVPNRNELRQIMNYAGERGRCSISLMAFAGLRPQVLGDVDGRDGLEIRDLPEMQMEGEQVAFTMVPTRVVVRPELSKAGHKYFTFLTSEGCEYLKDYLEKRLALGEKLEPDSAIISVKPGYEGVGFRSVERTSRHLATKTITKEIRDAMRPRFDWRPYVLRAYFDTQLLVAENHGKTSHAYRQFWMGHKGDMEARYTTNKGRLPEDLIEDMRRSFRDCQEYLQTTKPEASEERLREAFRKQLLLVAGFSKEEMEETDTSKMSDEEFQEIVRKRLLGEKTENCAKQKVITISKVEGYLNDGWEFVSALPNGKVIIKLPR